jgi:hypothetical protein
MRGLQCLVKPLALGFIAVICCSNPLSGQESPFKNNPTLYPPRTRPSTALTLPESPQHFVKKPGHYAVPDWKYLIDSLWGPGLPTSEKLSIFDNFWGTVDQQWGGFPNSTVNWDSLRTRFRGEVQAGVSRGRFYAIMSRMGFALQEIHTFVRDNSIDSSMYVGSDWYWLKSGLPVVSFLGHGITATGMGLAPMDDSSLFVYRVQPNHPLGIQPGDIILGYDGRRWVDNMRERDSVEFPIASRFSLWGSHPDSYTYTRLVSAGSSYTLYDTMDVVRYATGDTVHLSTRPLAEAPVLWDSLYCSDQLPVAGVPMPDAYNGKMCSWGVIQGSTIGYIYAYDWASTAQQMLFTQAVRELANTTTGLILDFRFNLGGSPSIAYGGFSQLINKDFSPMMDLATRTDTKNHMAFSRTPVNQTWVGQFVPGPDVYDHPIAVLIGPVCLSAGDYTAFFMRFHPMARFFGKRSNTAYVNGTYATGAFAGSWEFQLPKGCCYSNFNGEEYLIHKGFNVDEEVWQTRDDAANGVDAVVKRAVEWVSTLTYAHDAEIRDGYLRQDFDSALVTAVLANPLGHSSVLTAIVADRGGTVHDSLRMFNDGTHGDATPGDSVWSCYVRGPLGENFYEVCVRTDDITQGTFRRLPAAVLLTTAGPVAYMGDTASAIPRWGAMVSFLLKVGNTGSTVSIPSVTGTIRPLDTAATVILGKRFTIGNLAPGQVLKSGLVKIAFSLWCTGTRDIPFELVFSSQGIEYWRDTMSVHVTPAGAVAMEREVPKTFALEQNYPNPFNPSTTIRFELPHGSQVSLKVYNTLGQEVATLVNETKPAGVYTVEFDAAGLSTGVYFCRLEAGSFVQTRKLVLLR